MCYRITESDYKWYLPRSPTSSIYRNVLNSRKPYKKYWRHSQIDNSLPGTCYTCGDDLKRSLGVKRPSQNQNRLLVQCQNDNIRISHQGKKLTGGKLVPNQRFQLRIATNLCSYRSSLLCFTLEKICFTPTNLIF